MATAFHIRQAAALLRRGGVIVYPTDTIYGLGCDPRNAQAVQRIYRIKQRPGSKSLILLAANAGQLDGLVDLSRLPADFAWRDHTPTTWVLPASPRCPHWLRHRDGTLAARITGYPLVQQLCHQLGHAIVSTSANFSGRPPLARKLDLRRVFGPQVDAILHSDTVGTGKASTIRHYSDQRILRASP